MEDKAEIEAKNQSVVEVKKETKKKGGLKDILKDKKTFNKKYQKVKYNSNKEIRHISGNNEKYNNNYNNYNNNDYNSRIKNFNSKDINTNNDIQLDKYKDKNIYNNNSKYKKDYNDYGYNNFNSFRDNNSNNYYYKHNFINSSKKNINNDTRLDKPKDKKYNYGYGNYRQYSQTTYNSGEFQPKKFFGKINFSSNDQYTVRRPYDYKYKEKNEENKESSTKQMFFNSKIDNNSKEGNLKELDSSNDLFIGKYMKYTSAPNLDFNSSNENSLQNIPYVENIEKKVEKDNYKDNNIIEKTNDLHIEETNIDIENKKNETNIKEDDENNEKEEKELDEENNINEEGDNKEKIKVNKEEENKEEDNKEKENKEEENKEEENKEEENKEKENKEEENKENGDIEYITIDNNYTNNNYNNSVPFYKKVKKNNNYYNNQRRKRQGSYHPKKYPKNIFPKGDEDYFNIALRDQDNTNVYSTIANDYNYYNDNYYNNERNKTIAYEEENYKKEEKNEDEIKNEENNNKEEKKEIKKKRRKTAVNPKPKDKKNKDIISKGEGKVTIKTSGAKNLKDLLG